MQRRVAAFFVFAFASAPLHNADAAGLPEIRTNASNAVPECVTPGRMTGIPEEPQSRHQPALRQRRHRVHATGREARRALGFRLLPDDPGDRRAQVPQRQPVRRREARRRTTLPASGATGGGEPGESFKDIATGVRAHLEHLLLYSGEKLENPVAERTRKVQEWGVLTKWQSRFTRPITFTDLAAKWAPGSRRLRAMLDGIAERFQEFCEKPDPRPELAAAVRRELRLAEARKRAAFGRRSLPSAPSRTARPRRPRGAPPRRPGDGLGCGHGQGCRPCHSRCSMPRRRRPKARGRAARPDTPASADPVAAKILESTPKADAPAKAKAPREPARRTQDDGSAAPRPRSRRVQDRPLPPAPPSRSSRPPRRRPLARSAASGPPATAARRR